MKKETKEIKKLFEKKYLLINSYYLIEKPSLKIAHYESGTSGSCTASLNKISINSTSEHYEKTIIHELLHLVNYIHFNDKDKKKKLGHNKQFWLLCYEFGLTEKDYGYGLTKTMEKAKEEYLLTKVEVLR